MGVRSIGSSTGSRFSGARLPANEEAVQASETTPSNPYPVAVE